MKPFLDEDFLLQSEPARRLYHDYARAMPIFDYHCHLSPQLIADDHHFADITEAWLAGDHYKWRAMRTNGVAERLITGDAAPREKFQAWAETVPYTIGNPLYHWTHLELKHPFAITGVLLSGTTAEEIWEATNDRLAQPEFGCRGLLRTADVRYVGTTDDPADDLSHHRRIAEDPTMEITVAPSFRPDKAYAVDRPAEFAAYMTRLAHAAGRERIATFEELLTVLSERIDYFARHGCRVSDHALTVPVYRHVGPGELQRIFAAAVKAGGAASRTQPAAVPTGVTAEDHAASAAVTPEDHAAFATAVLTHVAREYAQRGWVFQLHIGAQRNNNTRMYAALGPDTGFDSIADGETARPLAHLLDALDRDNHLPKTILYGLNPRDNDLLATMIGNFQDGSTPGKIQLGSGWWFNDQKDGMERQMTALANMGLLSRFVGMLTDSRSFLSFPRHEYFRRTLCNLIGGWVDAGEAPADYTLLGRMVQDIAWNNAERYFGIDLSAGTARRTGSTGRRTAPPQGADHA